MEASDGDADRLCYDCPLVPEVMIMMEWLAGASVAAARALTSGNLRIAINWYSTLNEKGNFLVAIL